MCWVVGPLRDGAAPDQLLQFARFRQSLPTDDPEWEEMKRQKDRQARREEDLEMLHNSMFG